DVCSSDLIPRVCGIITNRVVVRLGINIPPVTRCGLLSDRISARRPAFPPSRRVSGYAAGRDGTSPPQKQVWMRVRMRRNTPEKQMKSLICNAMSGFYTNAFKVGVGLLANLRRFDGFGSRVTFLWSTL